MSTKMPMAGPDRARLKTTPFSIRLTEDEKPIRRLVRLIGLMPTYRRPDTSRPAKGYKTCPYLQAGLRVDRPNQVWC